MKKQTVIDIVGLKMVKRLRKHIEKWWGKRCREYNRECFVCKLYRALDILEGIMEWQYITKFV